MSSEPPFRIYDLSVSLRNHAFEPYPPEIAYFDHEAGARRFGRMLNLPAAAFPGGWGLANERITLTTHSGTHLDAPYHFGPTTEGQPSPTIDEIPLEWCFGRGVRLDVRHRKAAESVSVEDVRQALAAAGHDLRPFDIVLMWTGADKAWDDPGYSNAHPGISPEATEWLIDQGVRVMGTDGYGWDKPFAAMAEDYRRTGDSDALWPSHFLARKRTYLHVEKLANLEQLPSSTGFHVAVFPVKIERASAGWCRAVAIFGLGQVA